MYKNVGKKIKTIAKIFAWVLIALTVILGVMIIVAGVSSSRPDFVVNGVVTLLVGPLFSWIGSLAFYGFGQLIEDNEETRQVVSRLTVISDYIDSKR